MTNCVALQGLAGAIANPVISTSVAGLATSACQHSTLEVRSFRRQCSKQIRLVHSLP